MARMRRVPKKNIGNHMADVRHPEAEESVQVLREGSEERELAVTKMFEKHSDVPGVLDGAPSFNQSGRSRRGRRPRFFIALFLMSAVFLGGGFFIFRLYSLRVKSLRTAAGHFREFQSAFTISGGAGGSPEFSGSGGGLGISGSISHRIQEIFSLLKDAGTAYGDIQLISSRGLAFMEETAYLKNNLIGFLIEKRGDELISHLTAARDDVTAIHGASARLAGSQSVFKNFLLMDSGYALALQIDTGRLAVFLDSFIAWLNSGESRHFLVFFNNTSEMRPGGGFLGSYAELTIRKGSIENITIRDINEADKVFDPKIVPPVPLQLIVNGWRAADANWFFNFSDSAAKTISFLEASNLYRKAGITFDGAISISPSVVRDALAATGPITVSPENIKFTGDTFLIELQKAVQAAQAKKTGDPKKILEKFSAALLLKIQSLDNASKTEFADIFSARFLTKDIAAYFKDENLESFLRTYAVAGDAFPLPQDFSGDYLAFASANIGGQKSDLYIRQTISLESQIGNDGVVSNHLVITRAHQGNLSPFSWYRAPNQSYLEIFTPPGAKLVNISGGMAKNIPPPMNYAKERYVKDADVIAIESSTRTFFNFSSVQGFSDSGKNVFATWVKTTMRTTSTVTLDYSHRLPAIPAGGDAYEFVFDKQSGSGGSYRFTINAPVGFHFKENGLPIYEYASDAPPGRVVLQLTLEKAR